jgi:hypothetical protein
MKNRAAALAPKVNTDSLNRKKNTRPSHELAAYAGVFEQPGYGRIHIVLDKDTLWANYNKSVRKSYLRHYHYDVFETISIDAPADAQGGGDANKVRFITNNKGEITTLETQMDPAVKDIVFNRVQIVTLTKKDLEQYVGDYEMIGQTVKVYIRGENTLMALVPGQPDYELVPTKKHEFDLKMAKGFSVKFEPNDKGEIIAMSFIQPNGIFKAVRKQNKK